MGAGSATIGQFSNIDWSSGSFFIKTEVDVLGGTNYTLSGVSQLLSVPFALYAANGVKGDKGDTGEKGDQGDPGVAFDDEAVSSETTWTSEKIQSELDAIAAQYEDILLATNGHPSKFRDSRDGNIYEYVIIGGQTWMKENLRYLPMVYPASDNTADNPRYYVYGYEGTSVAEAMEEENYKTHGVLYNWPAAIENEGPSDAVPSGVKGVCPDGWHLPSAGELDILKAYVEEDASKLKANSLWVSNPGNNETVFTALPSGGLTGGNFSMLGYGISFHTTTVPVAIPTKFILNYLNQNFVESYGYAQDAISIRCVRD